MGITGGHGVAVRTLVIYAEGKLERLGKSGRGLLDLSGVRRNRGGRRQFVLVQESLRRRIGDLGQHIRGRDQCDADSPGAPLLNALIGLEEMRLIAANRPADYVPELVEARYGRVPGGVKKISRVELVVLKIFVRFAVEIVGSRFGDELELRARVAAIFSAKVVGDQLEFLDGVEIQRTETRHAGGDNIGSSDVIYRDIVGAPAASIRVVARESEKGVVGRERNDAWGSGRKQNGIAAHRDLSNQRA